MIETRLGGVAPFPQDLRAEHGYDNRGDHLSLSPLLMESFLKLGQSVVESDDFNPSTVGIWTEFFEEPKPEVNPLKEARVRLRGFLTRAFRRPIESDTLERYVSYVSNQLVAGISFTEAMKAAAAAAISSRT